ncbi:cNMP binding protein, partial [Oryctes borbonicus]
MQGYSVFSNDSRLILIVMSLLGLYLTVIFAGKIITLYFFHHRLLLRYQEAMRSLNRFLNMIKVNPQLKKTIIYNHEVKWSQQKGRKVHHTIEPLPLPMKSSILFEIYGKELLKTTIFRTKSKAFIRNLLPIMKHEIICKGGYVITINDVTRYTYILCKGEVEVLAPDGIVITTLHGGSMFGNLENKKRSRLRISVVTTCHAELLKVHAVDFHKLLEYEPQMKDEFRSLTLTYLNYIPGSDSITAKVVDEPTKKYKSRWGFVFNPNTRGMRIWNSVNLVFSCYLCIILDLYQLGSGEHSIYMMILQFTSDIVYTAHFIIKFRTAYEDESGTLVTDLRHISKKQCEHKFRLIIGIMSLLPFDIIVLFMTHLPSYKRKIFFELLRLNRLLRLVFIFEYFSVASEKLNINVYIMRFGFLIVWSSLAFCGIATLTTLVSCPYKVNIQPHVPSCEMILDNMTSYDQFRLYTRHIYLAANFLNFASQNMFFPHGALHTIFFIAMMVVSEALFFVCVSQVYSIIAECGVVRQVYMNNTERIKNFMESEEVSLSLIGRILTYNQLLWLKQRGNVYPSLLSEAPKYLQDAILNDAFQDLVRKHLVFTKCHSDCLRQIIQKCRVETFFRGDYVQFKGVIDNRMYFIFTGEIIALKDESVYDEDIVNVLRSGDAFG